ncbi:MAG: TetR/AcrR family transcriptional regulator [Bacilli bacterium]|jgi:AcrR family transcriptional regulator|nr:TetR/AcrR family transcriptional regulator [Bacilli bacterium]
MYETKDKILVIALTLFARDGYEGVSMKDIADQLNISKAALYKHYDSKKDIFDNIILLMNDKNKKKVNDFNNNLSLNKIKDFSMMMYKYWTEDKMASNFRKMLTLEQYRNPKMASLLNEYLMGGIIGNAQTVINKYSSKINNYDSNVLALEYFSVIYMLMNMYDQKYDKKKLLIMLETHIDYFMEKFIDEK